MMIFEHLDLEACVAIWEGIEFVTGVRATSLNSLRSTSESFKLNQPTPPHPTLVLLHVGVPKLIQSVWVYPKNQWGKSILDSCGGHMFRQSLISLPVGSQSIRTRQEMLPNTVIVSDHVSFQQIGSFKLISLSQIFSYTLEASSFILQQFLYILPPLFLFPSACESVIQLGDHGIIVVPLIDFDF
uniref:Uncharacterized protein n=1 Tax=Cucumis melo TaxID=3656 RepID=A0A9I9EBE0_CUCME